MKPGEIKTNVVYLIHFATPYKSQNRTLRHYIGFTSNLPKRLDAHARGVGSRLMAAVESKGIDWFIARTWATESYPGGGYALEKKIKSQRNHKRFCPMCKAEAKLCQKKR